MPNAMSDTSKIGAPDYLGDYVSAFRVGQALPPPAPPLPPIDGLTNAVTGKIAIPDGAQRDQAARRAELLGSIGMGLSSLPYGQRPSVLAHLAPALANEGIPADSIADFDPTDEALAMSVNRAQSMARLLNKAQDPA